VFGPKGVGLEAFRDLEAGFTNSNRTKVAGVKLFADGAIGSATAAIYGQYSGAESNGVVISPFAKPTEAMNTSGQLIYSAEKLKKMVMTASEAGYQVAVHSIGDYSTDLVLDAFEATGCASRHRLEHAMLLSNSQIERLAQLNPFVTFQPEFLLRFGGTYLKQLGTERTSLLKRSRSVVDAGLRLSFSSDRPIVPGDPRDGIRFAVQRGEGFVSAENISFEEAVDAYTVQGAMVNGDLGLMGTLGECELADYQLVDSVI
jgi:predicted amidohydrolase YtcJ